MRVLCLLSLFVLCLGAFGSTNNETTAITSTSPKDKQKPIVLEVGTGVSTAVVGAQPGLHVGARLPLGNSGLFGGLETGTYFYTTPKFGTYIPILLNLAARFDFSQNAYLMLGLAPGIGLVSYDNSSKPGGKDYSDTYFTLLIKPAFHLTVGEGTLVMFSPSIGTLNGNLLFSPVIGTAIEL